MSEIMPDKVLQPVYGEITDGQDPTPRASGLPEVRLSNIDNRQLITPGSIALTANQMPAPNPFSYTTR